MHVITRAFKGDDGMYNKYLSILNGVIENGHLSTVDIDTWYFVDCDLRTNVCRVIADIFPNQECLCWIERILHIGTDFFMIVRNSKLIISVNLDGDVRYFGNKQVFEANNCFLYTDACIVNNMIYMLPGSIEGVITIFDPKRCCFVEDIPLPPLVNYFNKTQCLNCIFRYIHNETDDEVRFCVYDTNIFCVMNLKTMKMEVITFEDTDRFWQVTGDMSNTIIMEIDSYRIFRYDEKKDTIMTVDTVIRHDDQNLDWTGYKHIYYINNWIWAIPAQMNVIELYDVNGNLIEILDMPMESELCFAVRVYKDKFGYSIQTEDAIYLLPFSTNGLVEVNLVTFEMQFHPLTILRSDISNKRLQRVLQKNTLVLEAEAVTLENYLIFLGKSKEFKRKKFE